MKADREIKVRCSACGHLTRIPTVTNADRIRASTDEELAEWLSNVLNENSVSEGLCPQTIEFSKNCYKNNTDCNDKICIMAWLKKEVDDG